MFRSATAALAACLLAVSTSFAVAPRVNDGAKFFSDAAVEAANQKIKRISTEFKKDLVIDTVASVPADMQAKFKEQGKTKFFREWSNKRAMDASVNGVYILICREPGHVQVEAGDATRRSNAFNDADRARVVQRMTEAFKEKKFDAGLTAAVDTVYSTFQERLPRKATAPVPLNPATTRAQPAVKHVVNPAKAGNDSILSWVCFGLLAVGIIWIIFRVIGALTGAGRGGAANAGGMGGPMQGGMGGGGGGFMTSLLGGIFGAAAGNWLYDSFLRGGHSDTGTANMMGGSSYGESTTGDQSAGESFTNDSDAGGGDFDSGDAGGGFDSGGFDGGGFDSGGGDF